MHELQLPVQNWLKFLSTQVGRDKVYRFVQYFARFLSYHLKTHTSATDLATRLQKLSMAIGLGRKRTNEPLLMVVFRMGKPLDFMQTALKTLSVGDEVVRVGTIMKCTGYGGWLVLDMLQWVELERG
ncbi:Peroxin-11 [Paramicrosporidium saccamoebae]|uniref:Peroxin-11 n=1 Tax=Paramicrosporidium saccamoebae TaxID=1246581 RepID=A0A2H9TG62_9FUNG|nr:Peroxin-11 [Paramicrosporidium saccamoebae]